MKRKDSLHCLKKKLRETGLNISTFNAGYSGSTLLHTYNNLINKIYPHSGPGGYILSFIPLSDIDYYQSSGGYWNTTKRGATILPQTESNVGISPNTPNIENSVIKLMECIKAFCSSFDLKLTFLTCPFSTIKHENFKAGFEKRNNLRETHNNLIREWALKDKVSFLDLEKKVNGKPGLFYDELHLNNTGQEEVSQIITNFLKEELY